MSESMSKYDWIFFRPYIGNSRKYIAYLIFSTIKGSSIYHVRLEKREQIQENTRNITKMEGEGYIKISHVFNFGRTRDFDTKKQHKNLRNLYHDA